MREILAGVVAVLLVIAMTNKPEALGAWVGTIVKAAKVAMQ